MGATRRGRGVAGHPWGRPSRPLGGIFSLLLALVPPSGAACSGDSFRWSLASPDSQGLDGRQLSRWGQSLLERGTGSLVVLRNDKLVLEAYGPGMSRHTHHYSASLAKGVVGGLGIALLLDDGRVSLDRPASSWLPEWRGVQLKSEVTLRQLGSHTAGLEDAEVPGLSHDQLTDWKGAFWERDKDRTPMHLALEETPIRFPPGRGFAYSNPGFAVLSMVAAVALDGAPQDSLRALLRDRIFRPIGVQAEAWSIGYGDPFLVDGREVWATWGGGSFTADTLARVGRLLLRRGDWDGQRILDPRAIEAMVTAAPRPAGGTGSAWPRGAMGWWTNADGIWPELPRDALLAAGAGHQILLVVPSLDLVVVRMGAPLGEDAWSGDYWTALHTELIEPLVRAFPEPPVPYSETLAGAWFAPSSTVHCRAEGSDNWPITWGTDGRLFTAYGDGWGFEPFVEEKLSLGFATVLGLPPHFLGENLRAPTGEQKGDGRAGGKASGVLAVDGTLYMLVRNLANARLAWSEDGGRTWTWGSRFEESFGSPTFLQFGRGYEGARDDYVYIYSQDGPSAYEPSDTVVLARVHRERIRERASWEFFAGRDETGAPRWSSAMAERRPLFEDPGGCLRSEVVYGAGLDRYLMALGADFEGGWGLYEAPEPWGPWSTVYRTSRWDVGDTHSYRLPTPWISDEGRTLHLVYSGIDEAGAILDGFCVRRLRIPDLRMEPPR